MDEEVFPAGGADTHVERTGWDVLLSSKIVVAMIFLAIIAIGYLDYLWGFQISLFPLYLLPVAVISWNQKLSLAIATSIVACAVIIFKAFGESFSHESFRYWDILSKSSVLFLFSWATWKIKQLSLVTEAANRQLSEVVTELMEARAALIKSNETLETRVAERTRELTVTIGNLEAEIAERIRLERKLEVESSERIRTERELHQNELLLVQQSKMAAMGEMIGNIAHQWRQPLNVLSLIAQELLISYRLGLFTEDYLGAEVKKTRETIDYMSRTIDDFRNFFRPDKIKVDFKAAEVIKKTLSLMEDSFRQAGIIAEITTSADPVVNGYPNEFSQVILNILSNARDAFSEGGVQNPKISISIGREDGKTVVSIVDNAGGIPEDILHRIFEPYFTTKEDKGTGVGLYMSKRIVEGNMNGTLTARNVGDGAEFRITI